MQMETGAFIDATKNGIKTTMGDECIVTDMSGLLHPSDGNVLWTDTNSSAISHDLRHKQENNM
jgi:hypothetical protein